jgi:hypothetical protein
MWLYTKLFHITLVKIVNPIVKQPKSRNFVQLIFLKTIFWEINRDKNKGSKIPKTTGAA